MKKNIICCMLIILYAMNSFAFIISDKDGQTFITKKEFEVLKKDYNTLVEGYRDSLDSKIDGAISEYTSSMITSKTETFDFDVYSDRCAVCNSDTITNLKYSKVGIDWLLTHTNVETVTTGMVTSAMIKMKRDGVAGYELFKLASDDASFDYYDNNAKIETSATSNFSSFSNSHPAGTTATFNNNDNILTVRWHADPWAKLAKVRNPGLGTNRQYSGYDDRFSKPSFFSYYGSFFNGGNSWPCNETTDKAKTSIISSVVVTPNAPAYLLMDNNETANKSKIWVKDPSIHNESMIASSSPIYNSTNQTYNTPTAAGVTTTGFALLQRQRNYYNTGENVNNKIFDGTNNYQSVTWVTGGDYQNISTSASYTDTAGTWYEFHLEGNELDQKQIKNANILDAVISKYGEYGYHGYVTEGMPIGVFAYMGDITFDIDTSTFTNGCYFGISLSPFDNASNKLSDMTKKDNGLILYIDGVEKPYNRVTLSAGTHKVRIRYNRDDKNAIFYKIGLSNASDKTKCFVFNMPTSYIYSYSK